jgi:hypothetical protein
MFRKVLDKVISMPTFKVVLSRFVNGSLELLTKIDAIGRTTKSYVEPMATKPMVKDSLFRVTIDPNKFDLFLVDIQVSENSIGLLDINRKQNCIHCYLTADAYQFLLDHPCVVSIENISIYEELINSTNKRPIVKGGPGATT